MPQPTFLEQLMKERKALSVSELTARIKNHVESRFVDVWVEGEISNFKRHASGHWYFTLKDEAASIRCASFRMQNRLVRFGPEDGLTVRARGRLCVYEARGEYQLLVEYLEPVGAGALQIASGQLKLAAEGSFSERKRNLPLVPRRIGVVTSPSGAAIRDVLRVIRRRNEGLSVLIAPTRVQGDGAGLEVALAIEALNSRSDVDVIIVGRGGGSTEDLGSFNEECVARAIFASRAPVISAVGHESDFTIADMVADLRASTPSAAAEMVAMARDQIAERLSTFNQQLATALHYRVLGLRRRVLELESSRAFDAIPMRLRTLSQRIDSTAYSMETSLRQLIRDTRAIHQLVLSRLHAADVKHVTRERRGKLALLNAGLQTAALRAVELGRKRLSIAAGKLDSLSPLGVLGRGYAIAFDREGRVIRRASDVDKGDACEFALPGRDGLRKRVSESFRVSRVFVFVYVGVGKEERENGTRNLEKNFESSLKELEEIVGRLETGDLPLEQSLELFEQGIRLSRDCQKRLDEAERKVEILLKGTDGTLTSKPFDEPEE
jgi:exodeoxyribonuclease VII large subunit